MVGTRYPIPPLPPIPEQTEMIELGPIAIGVGYRVLNDAIAAEYLREVGFNPRPEAGEAGYGNEGMEDGGVSIHVFGRRAGAWAEYFRFDCFEDEPHYHYAYPDEKAQRRVFLDPILEGDPQEWALQRLCTRLPEILREGGAPELARRVDPAQIEAALPRIRAAIARAERLRASLRRSAGAA
jgi:hypothetical protein